MDVQEAGAVAALDHIFPQDSHPFPRADIQARWLAEIADPDIDVYVIEDHRGEITGFAAIRANELLHFGTAPQTWGTGLAAAAHRQIVRRLTTSGAARARLRVFEANLRARRFYQKQGWRQTDRLGRTSFPPHPVLLEYELDL
ncbi:MAG TPA: GNAT family N-acetyltransferase [Rugosimonospora sp.]|nr:GNAT family N-acetyltransferase [Rugosimonospora sp.]